MNSAIAPVMALDRLDEAALDPEAEVAAQDLVGDHVHARPLELLGHPADQRRAWPVDVGEHRALEHRGEVLQEAAEDLAAPAARAPPRRRARRAPVRAQSSRQTGQSRAQGPAQRMTRILGGLAHARSQRGHDAVAVDQAEEIRHAEPEARIATRLPAGSARRRSSTRPATSACMAGRSRLPARARKAAAIRRSSQSRWRATSITAASAGAHARPREHRAHALDEVVDAARRKLADEPARHRARRGLDVCRVHRARRRAPSASPRSRRPISSVTNCLVST